MRPILASLPLLVACGGSSPPPAHWHGAHFEEQMRRGVQTRDMVDLALDDVARAHGAPGPWAVAGYRMGQHALAKLGLPRGSFDLEVVHTTPKKVQYSCIADGAGASTGASVGKLNLRVRVTEASDAEVVTVYRNTKTGQAIALRPSPAFVKRWLDVPTTDARALGREVMKLSDADMFEEVSVP